MSLAAKKPPSTDIEPGSGEKAIEDGIPRSAPRAPTAAVWAALTPEERDLAELALLTSETLEEIEERDAMAEGDTHLDAKMEIRDTLRAYYGRLEQSIYIGANIKVFYPGEKGFTPDIIAVTDVKPGPRNSWMVSREGKGIDLALEVHASGDRRKDTVENVKRYASLGISEYFVYDIPRVSLKGYRLPKKGEGQAGYEVIRPKSGRHRSEVLDLELSLEGRRLRFYAGTAELVTTAELAAKLEQMVESAQARAEQEQTRAEQEQTRATQEQTRAEQACLRLSTAILTILRARGLAVDETTEQRVLGCSELPILDDWLSRALTVTSAAELF